MESLLELLNTEQNLIADIRRDDGLIDFWNREFGRIEKYDQPTVTRMIERINEDKKDNQIALEYVRCKLGRYIKSLLDKDGT